MLVLVAGNIYFSIQYTQGLIRDNEQASLTEAKDTERILASRFMKSFIDIVLNTKGTIAIEDRVRLEDQILQTKDGDLIKLWNTFVDSKDGKLAQDNAVKLMAMLANKML